MARLTYPSPRSILITGASSGIGAALARHYAAPGVTLFLGGRDEGRLAAVAADCRARGATVETQAVDVTDESAMRAWCAAADDAAPLDLVFANAGISGGTGGTDSTGGQKIESPAQARRIFAVNIDGVLNTVMGVQGRMLARGYGQIAIISSLAGFSGWPGAPSYSASKAAVRFYGEALRPALAPCNVGVSVVCPGFIRTPMTAVNDYAMPFMMDPDHAARRIARGLARNRGRIAFPWCTYVFAGMLGLLPPAIAGVLLARLPAKPAQAPDAL